MIRPRTRCWIWTAATAGRGKWTYGIISHDGRMQMAHRVSYEVLVGPIPEGLDVDHLCRHTLCINPDHIEPVTHQENIRRGYALKPLVTSCKHGHEYTPENTYSKLRPGGTTTRECRTCRREQLEAHYERRKSA